MISDKSMDFLFDTLKFYGDKYDQIADYCFDDVKRALNEIKDGFLPADTEIMPYGSYFIKSNYQILEPMEFYVVLHGDKNQLLSREYEQKQESLKLSKRKKRKQSSIKNIYQNILSGSSKQENIVTSFDAAHTIMTQMQKYLSDKDVVYYKNNVVFIKFHTDEDIQILAVITVVYEFEPNKFEFKKYGISTNEDSKAILNNILQKNLETNGNYLVLCKLIKMLELELIITDMSNKYLSKKSLFIEHLLYNVPNTLYQGDDFSKIFVNITNYIKHCEADKLLLADNVTKMFPEHGYYAKSELSSIIKKLVYLCKYTNKMIDDILNSYDNENDKNQTNNNNSQIDTQNQKNVKKLGK